MKSYIMWYKQREKLIKVNVVMLGWIIKEILFSALENYRKFQLMMTLIWSWLKKPCSEEAG